MARGLVLGGLEDEVLDRDRTVDPEDLMVLGGVDLVGVAQAVAQGGGGRRERLVQGRRVVVPETHFGEPTGTVSDEIEGELGGDPQQGELELRPTSLREAER